MSVILAETRPPLARSFSTSTAFSTQVVRIADNSSSRAAFSERISSLALADPGIELMLRPPCTIPKLNDDRGRPEPFNGVSVKSAMARLSAWTGLPIP
jgi:hypothetical protein